MKVQTIQGIARKIGAKNTVNFIANRHVSQARGQSLKKAIDLCAWNRIEEETIANDFLTVESYGDLSQYCRD